MPATLQRPKNLVSLDLETSGLKPSRHAILSIGAVDAQGDEFYEEIRHENIVASPGAFRVHDLSLQTMDSENKLKLSDVDKKFSNWLSVRGGDGNGNLHGLGFQVGSFDLKFAEKHLPKSAAHFSYRSLDLNSALFAIDIAHGRELGFTRNNLLRTPKPPIPHNALVDAKASYATLEEIANLITGF